MLVNGPQICHDMLLCHGAGGARTRDQRIRNSQVWTAPVTTCVLLSHKVIGHQAAPAGTGQFRSIPGHWALNKRRLTWRSSFGILQGRSAVAIAASVGPGASS